MESSRQTVVRIPSQNRTLVIMAKAPKPGMVKTRLTQSLFSPAVTALYCCLLEDTVAMAKSLIGVTVAVMCPESDRDELAQLVGSGVQVVPQKGEGLAAGLTSVFRQFTAAGQQPVIAFNSDSPHLPPSVLERAFEALATRDVVVGPTHDGGYYLIGAKTAYATLFENDGMGTRNALETLLEHAQALKLSIGFTEPFYDIDVADDLIRLGQELRLAPSRAPRTAAWFAEWEHAVGQLHPCRGKL
ncbi:MAG TPA: TIGR04282 family arsenosugar biosynthesis glycosyltransferase [Terriglobales bacterium]|nr:TIGR04282 family arsenosugar biosynthesis glycosyltransferase [Terriglobales bacterium]